MSGISELRALRDIFVSSIDQIIAVCDAEGTDFPKLDDPVHPDEFSPHGIRNNPKVSAAIELAVTAAYQAIQTIRSPPITIITEAAKHTVVTSLGIVERADVAEILRGAGPNGKHVTDIATHSGLDPKKLARILRLLATNHFFKEVSPDVFANNLLSSMLDSGKDITEPGFRENKHNSDQGMSALVGFNSDETIRSLAQWRDVLFDPQTAFSEDIVHCGWQPGLNTDLSMWDYYATPEGRYRGSRFNAVMANTNKLQPPQAAVKAFDWGSLPLDAVVVDVGGGQGHVSLEIARAFPNITVVLEDRLGVIADAHKYWSQYLPSHQKAGKLHLLEHDFFEPQPPLPKTPDVFFLRQIIHDWSDGLCVKILSHLRTAAGPHTKLFIVDSILDYACFSESQSTLMSDVNDVPKPLLPNMAGANLHAYQIDVLLGSVINAGERTIDGYKSVIEAGGWKLVEDSDTRVDLLDKYKYKPPG
ncbi:hypothetical protein EIP91_000065 [Steccherinum ochraceum]|uniref:O-methyltransferase C-terminal domain-containing protein n=1 Tax=Steccherinum ochraceum TaxID=92696 RepID=A0A4R0RVZ4_9APHY|nr:hypothetical protein EIP91_000065 [Steccherinum ochraceum]